MNPFRFREPRSLPVARLSCLAALTFLHILFFCQQFLRSLLYTPKDSSISFAVKRSGQKKTAVLCFSLMFCCLSPRATCSRGTDHVVLSRRENKDVRYQQWTNLRQIQTLRKRIPGEISRYSFVNAPRRSLSVTAWSGGGKFRCISLSRSNGPEMLRGCSGDESGAELSLLLSLSVQRKWDIFGSVRPAGGEPVTI